MQILSFPTVVLDWLFFGKVVVICGRSVSVHKIGLISVKNGPISNLKATVKSSAQALSWSKRNGLCSIKSANQQPKWAHLVWWHSFYHYCTAKALNLYATTSRKSLLLLISDGSSPLSCPRRRRWECIVLNNSPVINVDQSSVSSCPGRSPEDFPDTFVLVTSMTSFHVWSRCIFAPLSVWGFLFWEDLVVLDRPITL